jgi:hypothetical protein
MISENGPYGREQNMSRSMMSGKRLPSFYVDFTCNTFADSKRSDVIDFMDYSAP